MWFYRDNKLHKKHSNRVYAPWPHLQGPHRKHSEWLLFLPDRAHNPMQHCVCRRAHVWGMFGQCWKKKMLCSHLRAVVVPRALQHRRCQSPRPLLLLLKPEDQTLGTGLSKRISSWREDQTERLWCSFLARNRDKKHFALTFRTSVFTLQFLVSYLHLGITIYVLLTAPNMNNTEHFGRLVATYFMTLHAYFAWTSVPCICSFKIKKRKHENVETKCENNSQWYSKE